MTEKLSQNTKVININVIFKKIKNVWKSNVTYYSHQKIKFFNIYQKNIQEKN
jgi:hypothetical protein